MIHKFWNLFQIQTLFLRMPFLFSILFWVSRRSLEFKWNLKLFYFQSQNDPRISEFDKNSNFFLRSSCLFFNYRRTPICMWWMQQIVHEKRGINETSENPFGRSSLWLRRVPQAFWKKGSSEKTLLDPYTTRRDYDPANNSATSLHYTTIHILRIFV